MPFFSHVFRPIPETRDFPAMMRMHVEPNLQNRVGGFRLRAARKREREKEGEMRGSGSYKLTLSKRGASLGQLGFATSCAAS